MSTEHLDPSELTRWEAWKRAGDTVMGRVGRAIEDASGLSSSDFAVLTRLEDLGGGSLRQGELAASLGWDRSRLSRQLARMATRGHVESADLDDRWGKRISITQSARAALARARPAHASAIRAHLLEPAAGASEGRFWAVVESLGATRLEVPPE